MYISFICSSSLLFTLYLKFWSKAFIFGSRPIPNAQLQSTGQICPVLEAGVEIQE